MDGEKRKRERLLYTHMYTTYALDKNRFPYKTYPQTGLQSRL